MEIKAESKIGTEVEIKSETKKEIRARVRRLRKELDPAEEERANQAIASRLLGLAEIERADCIYCYVDYNHEAATKSLIGGWLALKKRVAVPKVDGREMTFHYIESLDTDIVLDSRGLPGPKNGLVKACEEDALVLMPGVAFDLSNHRVGYGGGYYDRFLSEEPSHDTVAIAFDFQVFSQVPHEPFDIRPRLLVTPTRILWRTE